MALLVDGVTKLSQMSFRTVEEEQAENIRKMIIAMAKDMRVILIKLADRLHNMRTLRYLGKEKQIDKAKETLEVYAPLAHRLGIESVRWELEDLAFATLHPRKYAEIQHMVAQRRADRERDMEEARKILDDELKAVNIEAEISGRAKHFYSIYDKMVRKGKEFNEIFDLTALRVLVDSVKDCYAALGVIHSLWKPLPGRFKDYIAMPKFNMYQSLHTTVIGPQGKPLEIQIRTSDMHETAQFGIAAHWFYKEKGGRSGQRADAQSEKLQWLRQIMDWQSETKDAGEFMESLRIDLFHDEVYVFTPKGEVKRLPVGSTPVDFAYAIHTDVGHRCIGAKVDGRIVPLTYKLQSGDIVEILTSKTAQGPSRDWLQFVESSGARNKIRQWFKKERREDAEHLGREALLDALRKQGLPAQRLIGSDLLTEIMRETNHTKKEDFFAAVGTGKVSPQHVVTRIVQMLNPGGRGHGGTVGARGHSQGEPGSALGQPIGHPCRWHRRRCRAATSVLSPGAGRRRGGLHLPRQRHHRPQARLSQCQGSREEPGTLHPRPLGFDRQDPPACRDPGGSLRSQPSAGGHLAHSQRERGQHHRRTDLHGPQQHGQGPVRVRSPGDRLSGDSSTDGSGASTLSTTPTGSLRTDRRPSARDRKVSCRVGASPPLVKLLAVDGSHWARSRYATGEGSGHGHTLRARRAAAGELLSGVGRSESRLCCRPRRGTGAPRSPARA